MRTYQDGLIKILELDEIKDLNLATSELTDVHLVIAPEYYSEKFQPYPTKITYEYDLIDGTESLMSNIDKKRRYNLNRLSRMCESKFDFVILDNYSREDYQSFKKGYDAFIQSIPYGESRLEDDWYDDRSANHLLIKYFVKGSLIEVGGTLIKKFNKSPKLSMSYGWMKDEARNAGLATYEVRLLIDYATSNNYRYLSYGQDNNLYGGHLSVGLHHFKTYYGAKAKITASSDIKSIFITDKVNLDKLPIIFYTGNDSQKLRENRYNC